MRREPNIAIVKLSISQVLSKEIPCFEKQNKSHLLDHGIFP